MIVAETILSVTTTVRLNFAARLSTSFIITYITLSIQLYIACAYVFVASFGFCDLLKLLLHGNKLNFQYFLKVGFPIECI